MSRGSSTPVASRLKFFMTKVNGRESLVVDRKISYIRLLSKLNKQHIGEQNITKYFLEIYLKMTQWWLIFQIIVVILVVKKTRLLWPLKGESTLQKQTPKAILQICVWQLLLKSFKNVCEAVKLKKKKNEHLFSFVSNIFISFVKQLCYIMAFQGLSKTPIEDHWQFLNLLQPDLCRVMLVYGRKIQEKV